MNFFFNAFCMILLYILKDICFLCFLCFLCFPDIYGLFSIRKPLFFFRETSVFPRFLDAVRPLFRCQRPFTEISRRFHGDFTYTEPPGTVPPQFYL